MFSEILDFQKASFSVRFSLKNFSKNSFKTYSDEFLLVTNKKLLLKQIFKKMKPFRDWLTISEQYLSSSNLGQKKFLEVIE